MSDFQVERGGLESAARTYDDGATGMDAVASGIADPDPMMLGVFLSPLVSFVGPLVTEGARGLLQGVGHMHKGYAQNLRATAQRYESTETDNTSASSTMVTEA